VTAGTEAIELVTELSRRLRERGIATTTESTIDGVRTLAAIDTEDKSDVHLAFRALFAQRRDDLAIFEQLFEEWWTSIHSKSVESARRLPGPHPNPEVVPPGDEPQRAGGATALTRWAESLTEVGDEDTIPLAAPSVRDATGARDFRHYSSDDLPALEQVAAEIVRRLRRRRSRRWRHARRGGRLDPRRIVRLALATGGDPIRLARRERTLRRTKLVVLCDVSGSMDLYSRFLLQVIYALQHAFARVETFAFSTRLVRITESLERGSYREALDALATISNGGWSGGTKIGDSVDAVRVGWPRLFDRRTAVIILSDGWDTGDPAILGSALSDLRRRVGRIVWLNPLLGSSSYEPLTRGMQAALPHLDVFAPAHDLASLERLASHLSF
jgi:uncharacterized protein with von Willebrand factor type A (vWA) domain